MRNLNDIIKGCKNFKYSEVIHSDTAVRRKIDNNITSDSLWNNAEYLAQYLQKIRDNFNQPVIISSWYRSPNINKVVGGSNTSAHASAMAVDFTIKNIDIFDVFTYIYNTKNITQLLIEGLGGNSWIHYHLTKGREKENRLGYQLAGKSVKSADFETIKNIYNKYKK